MPAYCADCGKPAVGVFDTPLLDANGEPLQRPSDISKLSDSLQSSYNRPLCKDCSGRRPGTVPSPK